VPTTPHSTKRTQPPARDCYSVDYVGHRPHHPEPIGIDKVEAEGNDIIVALPDVTVIFEDTFGAGDRPSRPAQDHRHPSAGMDGGIPPTGKQISLSGGPTSTVVNGNIAQEWARPDISEYFNNSALIFRVSRDSTPVQVARI